MRGRIHIITPSHVIITCHYTHTHYCHYHYTLPILTHYTYTHYYLISSIQNVDSSLLCFLIIFHFISCTTQRLFIYIFIWTQDNPAKRCNASRAASVPRYGSTIPPEVTQSANLGPLYRPARRASSSSVVWLAMYANNNNRNRKHESSSKYIAHCTVKSSINTHNNNRKLLTCSRER